MKYTEEGSEVCIYDVCICVYDTYMYDTVYLMSVVQYCLSVLICAMFILVCHIVYDVFDVYVHSVSGYSINHCIYFATYRCW